MSNSSTFWLISELQSALDAFLTAASDPLSAVLIAIGALIVGAASLAFGGLVLGALLDAIGDGVSRDPPAQPPE